MLESQLNNATTFFIFRKSTPLCAIALYSVCEQFIRHQNKPFRRQCQRRQHQKSSSIVVLYYRIPKVSTHLYCWRLMPKNENVLFLWGLMRSSGIVFNCFHQKTIGPYIIVAQGTLPKRHYSDPGYLRNLNNYTIRSYITREKLEFHRVVYELMVHNVAKKRTRFNTSDPDLAYAVRCLRCSIAYAKTFLLCWSVRHFPPTTTRIDTRHAHAVALSHETGYMRAGMRMPGRRGDSLPTHSGVWHMGARRYGLQGTNVRWMGPLRDIYTVLIKSHTTCLWWLAIYERSSHMRTRSVFTLAVPIFTWLLPYFMRFVCAWRTKTRKAACD